MVPSFLRFHCRRHSESTESFLYYNTIPFFKINIILLLTLRCSVAKVEKRWRAPFTGDASCSNFREMEELCNPQGIVPSVRRASAAWIVGGYSFRMGARFHCRKSGLRNSPSETTGRQREAITFVLRFLITPTLRPCAEMGHGCRIKHIRRHLSQWNLWWAFSHHAVNTTPPDFKADSDLALRN